MYVWPFTSETDQTNASRMVLYNIFPRKLTNTYLISTKTIEWFMRYIDIKVTLYTTEEKVYP